MVLQARVPTIETEQAAQENAPPIRRIGVLSLTSMTIVAAGLGLVLLLFACWAAGGVTAIRTAYSHLRGETILVDSHAKSFGIVAPGDRVTVSFRLTNDGREPVRIVGCRAGCSCMVPDDLPFAIGPKGSRDFAVSIKVPQKRGNGSVVARKLALTLFTSNPAQLEIPLTMSGQIRGTPGALNSGP